MSYALTLYHDQYSYIDEAISFIQWRLGHMNDSEIYIEYMNSGLEPVSGPEFDCFLVAARILDDN